MGLDAAQEARLKKSIEECGTFQGKYYLRYIYHILRESNQSAEDITLLVDHLVALIESIKRLKGCRFDENKAISRYIKEVDDSYAALAQEAGAQGFWYSLRQAILSLGGGILGTIGAVMGGLVGGGIGFFNDIRTRRVPTGIFPGIISGVHVGAALGYRLPDRLVKNPEQHALHYAIRQLHRTFESLTSAIYQDALTHLKNELLAENFCGDQHAFKQFLTTDIPYAILAADAGAVLSEKVQGYLGHHIWVTFTIPGQVKPIRIESGEELPIDENRHPERITQRERQQRLAKGEKLLEMLALHRVLSPVYVLKLQPKDFANPTNIKNLLTFQYRNKPGVTDCNTYIDEILAAVDEEPRKTKRFADQDKPVALWIRDAIQFLSPLPKELSDYEHHSLEEEDLEQQEAYWRTCTT